MGRNIGPGRGKICALEDFLGRYADECESDLARYYGLPLADLYTGRLTYRRLGVLVTHLPPESATKTAAREALDDDDAPVGEPAGFGPWSHTDLLLASVLDALHVLAWQQTQIHGGKRTSPPDPTRRPGLPRQQRGPAVTPAGITYLTELRERRARERGNPGR